MNPDFKIPPKLPEKLTPSDKLIDALKPLIGKNFALSDKTRKNGSNLRKTIAKTLEYIDLPELANSDEYEIVPLKEKGVPRIRREFIDTYIITTGESYNLQVWNRYPASDSLLIKYETGESLSCIDVRFVLVRVKEEKISSIFILSPKYIEKKFGKFGKPTIKNQIIISNKSRRNIVSSEDKILFYKDSKSIAYLTTNTYTEPKKHMMAEPQANYLYSMKILKEKVAEKLIGEKLPAASTKVRGQDLERKVSELLGYELVENDLLAGGYPDIKNQMLEVKVQDSPTIDLGKYSPEKEEIIDANLKITTKNMRYLIALTNEENEKIEGVVLAPGEKLGENFSYVSDQNYKCQRSIPMTFFDKYDGKVVFNPD